MTLIVLLTLCTFFKSKFPVDKATCTCETDKQGRLGRALIGTLNLQSQTSITKSLIKESRDHEIFQLKQTVQVHLMSTDPTSLQNRKLRDRWTLSYFGKVFTIQIGEILICCQQTFTFKR